MAVSKFSPESTRFFEEHFLGEQVAATTTQAMQTIALVGDSLLTDSIKAALEAKPHLTVIHLPSSGDGFDQRLPFLPDLVIVDLRAVQMAPILAYLLRFPGVPILGIEANSNQVIALSSRSFTAECSDDLTRIIKDMIASHDPVGKLIRIARSS
jgi:hypothetical protein